MKKILLSLKDLRIGGIEKAAVTLINYLVEQNYEVTLVVEKKEGELLKYINKNIKIIEYRPSINRNILVRKTTNFLKRLGFSTRYRYEFDVSISFTTYSKLCSYVARKSSKNSILWCHADYFELFEKDTQRVKSFFKSIHYNSFSKIVFVSQSGKQTFLQIFPEKRNVYYCNNLINSKEIYKMSKKKIDLVPRATTFLNVGRHDEKQKKLTRIIEAARFLKNDNYGFRIIFVGYGEDTEKYVEMTKKYNLQENVIFVGAKENPYPYFNIADCIILSSDYEGYPVVFLESYILNKPIITTDVSDYKDIERGRGIVVKKDEKYIYNAMKDFIKNGYQIKEKFNAEKYNLDIQKRLNEILEKF